MVERLFDYPGKNLRVEQRRKDDTSYKRRKYDRREKTFQYERTIHLSDTNSFGSVYFARFFEFQGEAREEFLQYFMGNDFGAFLAQEIGIVTVEATCKYYTPLFVYDDIIVNIQVPILKRAKFKLTFSIKKRNDDKQFALGEQWIGFTNKNGAPIPIPDIVVKNLKQHALNV